ncbi:MAG: hypothetical protein V1921_06330 [Candidatus Altiarchaeota archaeon]
MEPTKVVKLKLDGGGTPEKLPKLMEPGEKEPLELYRMTRYSGKDVEAAGEFYDLIWAKTEGWELSNEKIQKTLTRLEKGCGHEPDFRQKAGVFISALLNRAENNDLRLESKIPLDFLGFRFGKTVLVVYGDTGEYTAAQVEHATIQVNGNVGKYAGDGMQNGMLDVKGKFEEPWGGISVGVTVKEGGRYLNP